MFPFRQCWQKYSGYISLPRTLYGVTFQCINLSEELQQVLVVGCRSVGCKCAGGSTIILCESDNACSLFCSSIGIAKAALEAVNGENLFGKQGASWSVVFVDYDAHNRNRTIFEGILPRESNSKVCPQQCTHYRSVTKQLKCRSTSN